MGRQVTRRPRERPISEGVDEEDTREDIAVDLRGVMDDSTQPFCTCFSKKTGFGFDAHLGIYVHADPQCWRPSKAYYAAALQAGVLAPPIERGSSGEEEARDRGHRETVRRPRRPAAPSAEGAEGTAGRSGEEPGPDQTGGGDVLGERSNRTPRRARRRRDTSALWSDQY